MNSDFTKWLKTEETLDAKKFGQPIYSVNDMEKAFNAGKETQSKTSAENEKLKKKIEELEAENERIRNDRTTEVQSCHQLIDNCENKLAYIRAETEALKNEIIMKCYPQEYIQQRNGKIKLFLLVCHDLEKNPADLPGKSGELLVAIKEPHRLYTRVAKYSVATGFDCDDVIAWADKPEL